MVLIIKLGAIGDVLRTTPILHILDGEIDWLVKASALEILDRSRVNIHLYENSKDLETIMEKEYDIVLSLDDDEKALNIASLVKIKAKKFIGAFLNKQGIPDYTHESSPWFDMSLISKYGKEKADYLKFSNRKTWQEFLFEMMGFKFRGEKYILPKDIPIKPTVRGLIGIEKRASDRWPTKIWNKYDELTYLLERDGLEIRFFQQRESFKEYIIDISECEMVISGDTLAMHVSMALGKKTIALFTCTSPWEIYDYGLLTKVISPKLDIAFYKTSYVKEAVEAIDVEEVYRKCKEVLGNAR